MGETKECLTLTCITHLDASQLSPTLMQIIYLSLLIQQMNPRKGPVKLIKRVKIAHSFLQSVLNQFRVIILSLPT